MRKKLLLTHLQNDHSLQTAWRVLITINTVLLLLLGQLFGFIQEKNFYSDNGSKYREQVENDLMRKSSLEALESISKVCKNAPAKGSTYVPVKEAKFKRENSNFFFFVYNRVENSNYKTGVARYTNVSNEESKNLNTRRVYDPHNDSVQNQRDFWNSKENYHIVNGSFVQTLSPEDYIFHGFLYPDLKAKDEYYRVDQVFSAINGTKYAVFGLFALTIVAELFLGYYFCRMAGHRTATGELEWNALDQVPTYVLVLLYLPATIACVRSFWPGINGEMKNWPAYLTGSNFSIVFYKWIALSILIAGLVLVLVQTISVRVKKPVWWQDTLVYKAVRIHSIEKRFHLFVISVITTEALLFLFLNIVLGNDPQQISHSMVVYMMADLIFTAVLLMLIYVFSKNASVWILGTHRIAIRKRGRIPLDGLTGQFRKYAENINFLSRSANAEAEKRFINESFSTTLINGISDSLRAPLSKVGENIERLESGTIPPREADACAKDIYTISQNLKKTIEDLIRISKATTGYLEAHYSVTDAGMLVDQFAGEYGGLFEEKGIELVSSHPENVGMFKADGQFMWYIFDGIFSLFLEKVIPGTRVFLDTQQAGETILIHFQGYVNGFLVREQDVLNAKTGLGVPTAKVFTELQGGTIRYHCRQDLLNITLRFPQITEPENKE